MDGQGMHVTEILDRLVLLGLSEEEAQAYLHLARNGPSKAADVAGALKTGRTDAYRTLTNLVQRNFAHVTLGRPALYVARTLDEIVADVRLAEQARLDNVLRIQQEIVEAMSRLETGDDASAARNPFRLVQGRREAYRTMERMVLGAQRTIEVVTTHPASVTMSDTSGAFEAAMRRVAEGVQLRAILNVSPAVRERLADAIRMGAQYRHDASERFVRFVIVDGEELLMWVVTDPSARLAAEEDVAVWSSARDFVATQAWLFERAWAAAAPLDAPTATRVPVHEDAPGAARRVE